jgi:hypothetical protein
MPSSASTDALLRIGIIVLTLGTALIHFSLNFPDPVFILNGLGYLALLASLYLPVPYVTRFQPVVPWIFIGFTALTIFLWILLGERTAIGYTDKVIEIALILLLLIDVRGSRSSSR